jgi:hypothetical protein
MNVHTTTKFWRTRRASVVCMLLATQLAFVAGCPGNAKAPTSGDAAKLFAQTAKVIDNEASSDAAAVATAQLLEQARGANDSASIVGLIATLDAFMVGPTRELADYGIAGAIADRMPPTRARAAVRDAKLDAHGLKRGLLARAELQLAVRDGDAAQVPQLMRETGCVQSANISGPVSPRLHEFLAAADATAATVVVGAPGTASVRGYGCDLPLTAASARRGTRAVQFSVRVTDDGPIYIWLESSGLTRVRSGELVILERGGVAGSQETQSFAVVGAKAGTHLITVEAAMADNDSSIAVGFLDADGHALDAAAIAQPLPRGMQPFDHPRELGRDRANDEQRGPDERAAYAAFAIATGDFGRAEVLTEGSTAPLLTLLHARAVARSRTLPEGERSERIAKDAERLREAAPTDARSALWQLRSLAQRKSEQEAPLAGLALLKQLAATSKADNAGGEYGASMSLVAAVLASRAGLDGDAERVLATARKANQGTRAFQSAELEVVRRSPLALVERVCTSSPLRDHGSSSCQQAFARAGRTGEARKEAARLRSLRNAPNSDALTELRYALTAGDKRAAKAAYDSMLPGERTLSARYATTTHDAVLASELRKLMPTADSGAQALAPLLSALAGPSSNAIESEVEALWAQERNAPHMPGAPTAILLHRERYEIDARNLLHFTLFDLRRVSGTTDVEQNAQAIPPQITGTDSLRIVRRRVLKQDGRIVTPDNVAGAAQAHADLAQLEAGDLVESAFEGYATATDSGFLGLDSPDLLPARTAVLAAEIEIKIADSISLKPFAHPLLGKAVESRQDGARVYRYALAQTPVRRLEDGTPQADRSVGVSLQTATYERIAAALRDHFASLQGDDREVRTFTDAALAKLTPPATTNTRARLDALTLASSEAITEATSAALSDWNSEADGEGAGESARSMLLRRQGSRTWVLHRALESLGIPHELRLVERSAFTKKSDYPAHTGRFLHPILAVKVEGDGVPVLVDADVNGPALPPGHVSPELAGLSYLVPATGVIGVMPAQSDSADRDEIDIRLALDKSGTAKGQLTILLRGRASQDLAEALVRIVGSERDRALRGVVLGWIPRATVDEVALSSSEGSWQVALRANITIAAYANIRLRDAQTTELRLPGLDPFHAVFPRPHVATLSALLAAQDSRNDDFAIDRSLRYHVRRQLSLPAGVKIERLAPALTVVSSLLTAKRTLTVDGASLVEEFELALAHGTVERGAFAAFAGKLRQVDEGLMTGVTATMAAEPVVAKTKRN